MGSISFFSEETTFKPKQQLKLKSWIKQCIKLEGRTLVHLNYIFCTDEYLARINLKYLNHNTYTDIVTFDTSEPGTGVEGDIFVSIDRVQENASQLGINSVDELHRVIVHGVLHLLGYSDTSPDQKAIMRKKEDAYLSLRKF